MWLAAGAPLDARSSARLIPTVTRAARHTERHRVDQVAAERKSLEGAHSPRLGPIPGDSRGRQRTLERAPIVAASPPAASVCRQRPRRNRDRSEARSSVAPGSRRRDQERNSCKKCSGAMLIPSLEQNARRTPRGSTCRGRMPRCAGNCSSVRGFQPSGGINVQQGSPIALKAR
jgi:hypothetical protein